MILNYISYIFATIENYKSDYAETSATVVIVCSRPSASGLFEQLEHWS